MSREIRYNLRVGETEPEVTLTLMVGGQPARAWNLAPGTYVVGRGPGAELAVAAAGLSRRHFRLTVEPDGVRLDDLASKNGVTVDGRRVEPSGSTALGDGARVVAGQAEFELLAPSLRVAKLLAEAGELTVTMTRAVAARPGELPSWRVHLPLLIAGLLLVAAGALVWTMGT